MKHIKKIIGFCLAAAFLLTGCESVVKNAKPPEQYLDSQVLDGNFIDFSDPQQIYELYQAHYAAQQRDPNYTGYSELRGGLDIFGIPSDWSKNFISFQIVDYDEEKGNLIYALMTTNRTASESKYEYTADAEVTIGEDGKIHVKEAVEKETEDEAFLIAAVGFYNKEKDTNQFFFIDKDYSASKEAAGTGKYNLEAELEEDTVAVYYKEEILFYHYSPEKKTYLLDEEHSYNMKNLYTSTSFLTSASEKGLTAEMDPEKTTTLELQYQIRTDDETIMTIEDQERIQSYISELNNKNESMANAFLSLFVSGYSPEMLSAYLNSVEAWKNITFNAKDAHGLTDLKTCLQEAPIKNASVDFQTFAYQHVIDNKSGAFPAAAVAVEKGENAKMKDHAWLMVSRDAYYFVPFTIQIQFSGETIRTYLVDCEFYFKTGTGIYTNNADWGDAEFTIHDIRYSRDSEGKLVPDWIQLEYSEKETAKNNSSSASADLMDRLQALESSAESSVKQGTKWLDVNLKLSLVGKSYTVLANSQVEVSSLNAISDLMNAERTRIETEIAENNKKYRLQKDATAYITAKHIEDLQTMIDGAGTELAAAEAAQNSTDDTAGTDSGVLADYSGLSARFCTEDGQTDSAAKTIDEHGESLLSVYKSIYECQEKIKLQEAYIKACQYLKVNEVYDYMLELMESKLPDYTAENLSDAEKKELEDALSRQLVNRNLAVGEAKEFSVDEWMLPVSILGDSTEDAAWEKLLSTTMDAPETSSLVKYLSENGTQIQEKVKQTIDDLETLHALAAMTGTLTESGSSLQASKTESQSEGTLYSVGYEQVLQNYKNALNALNDILSGKSTIDGFRTQLHNLENSDIKICRFDLTISDSRKAELLAECDRMETLLKTIYTGSSDSDRAMAAEELNATKWQIDVDCDYIDGQIVQIQKETPTRKYYETLWSATVNRITNSHTSYVFSEEASGLYFDDASEMTVMLQDAPPTFSAVESSFIKTLSSGISEACTALYGEAFFKDMDQAVLTSVRFKNQNTSVHADLPDNRCQILLLSQVDGQRTDDETEAPKWSFAALPYSKLGLEKQELSLTAETAADTVKSSGLISKTGINNEMIRYRSGKNYAEAYENGMDAENVEVRDLNELVPSEEEAEEITYEEKIRGMLRAENTIFLDNPKIDWKNPEKSRFYFLNLSLDEGIRLYSLNPETGTLKRQNAFQNSDLSNYTEGCWFMGWWIPDSKTNYNDQGTLGGGKLVLLGLSREDMETYSSEEDGSLRELVADDIRHSKLYEINISANEMNACKIQE